MTRINWPSSVEKFMSLSEENQMLLLFDACNYYDCLNTWK